MSDAVANKGSRVLKALGIITVIGVLVAVGRIVLKVFREENAEGADAPDGV